MIAAALLLLMLSACQQGTKLYGTDISGSMPALEFNMMRANDEKAVTAQDYLGKTTILFFGYTHCPDICPTTLTNLADALARLGAKAGGVRVIFVTVDPERDLPDALKAYVAAFGTNFDGLRGSADALARLARRYRVIYQIKKSADGSVDVMHSDAVFIFDRQGKARVVETDTRDSKAIAQDIETLL